ncbi:DMT family transporter [Nakamurella lactea]|uniref:DMT family transporter n=1 Tax=Nakamurella lactea TaxID=459515 RepID=UPI0006841730|nr:DMT family transporter [Nakamurella lactea]
MSKRGWLLFVSLCVIWGVPYLLIRVAVRDLDPVVVAGGRTAIGALVLLPITLRRKALRPVLAHWRIVLIYTLVEIVGPWWLLGWSETRLTSSTAGLLIALVPLFTAILVTRLGHDRLDRRRKLGLAIGFAGVAALVGLDIDFGNLLAVAAAVGTAIGYAFGAMIIGRYLREIPVLGVITGSLILSTVIYAPFVVLFRPETVTAQAGWSVVALGLVCTAGAFLVLFALVGEVGAARATVITYINPAVAILLGVLLLNEPFTLGIAAGFPLVVIGAILATGRARTPDTSASEEPAARTPPGGPD